MAEIDIVYDDREVTRFMQGLAADQLPFATQLTINDAAKAFQAAQRDHMDDIFEVRNRRFVLSAVKIKPFASYRKQGTDDMHAKVSIDPPGGQDRADILTKFETQSQKLPHDGGSIAVPTEDVPRRASGGVQKRWRPRALQGRRNALTPSGRRSTAKGTQTFRGKVRGVLGIWERIEEGVRLLYGLFKRAPIRPNLDFVKNAKRVVPEEFNRRFPVNFDRAVRTRR